MQSTPYYHLKYRPDIDGLRGISIISVVLYHAFSDVASGGLVGVDIFFVISGYLITTIIQKGLNEGNFSFYDFYARRIKRLFPALILVLITCLIFGWVTIAAADYMELAKHAKASAMFYINFLLSKDTGSFDNSILIRPLTHLWSLAVEEQFYIVWPIILWVIWKKKFNLSLVLISIIALSFYLNVHNIHKYPTKVFFLPYYRFWEFLAGGLLAHLTLTNPLIKKIQNNLILSNILGIIGLIGAICSIIFLKKNHFPGFKALYPVICAVLIILSGPMAFSNRKILSSKTLIWIGRISYPIYLWHWPLFYFIHTLEGGVDLIIPSIALSVLLAWLTYKFIEIPIRTSTDTSHKAIIPLVLSLLIIGIYA